MYNESLTQWSKECGKELQREMQTSIGVCSPASPEETRGRSWVNADVLPGVKNYFSLNPGQHWLVVTGQLIKPICQL